MVLVKQGARTGLHHLPYFRTMPSLTALRVFHQRRIAVPVTDDALVLDVGSGDKPSWRADVLLDRYAGAEHSAQRSGRAAARVSRPLFDADAADMPFRDDAFDYAICSNLLEHVADPVAVAAELQPSRTGRLHRGAGGRQREDRRLPQPRVVVPPRG